MIQDDVDPTENLKVFQPDVLVHGDDWNEDFPGAKYMRDNGKEVVLTHYTRGRSTTRIIEDIYERCQRDSK